MKDIPFMRSLFFQFELETSANEPRQTNHEKGLLAYATALFHFTKGGFHYWKCMIYNAAPLSTGPTASSPMSLWMGIS